jgi:hypothetical protein
MALTPAEKQKRYRERQKVAQKAAPDLTMNFVKGKLSEFVRIHSRAMFEFEFVEYLVPVGLEFPDGFFDERATYDVDDLVGTENSLSGKPLLERMEALAANFLFAATELYGTINEFKLSEIDARIAEIEQADLSDPKAKAKALQDIVTLQGIKAQLEGKTFRRSFAEISVKGSAST